MLTSVKECSAKILCARSSAYSYCYIHNKLQYRCVQFTMLVKFLSASVRVSVSVSLKKCKTTVQKLL